MVGKTFKSMETNRGGSCKIYLAGPVENEEDAETWRRQITEDNTHVNFLDPTLLDHKKIDSDHELMDVCKRAVQISDGMIINWDKDAESVGTHWEHSIAYQLGKPIVVMVPEDVDPYKHLNTFMYHHADHITTKPEFAVRTIYEMRG